MDSVQQQFIAALRRLSKILGSLEQRLGAISDQTKGHQETTQAETSLHERLLRVEAESQKIPAISTEQNTRNDRAFRQQWVLIGVTLLGFGVAAIYAGISWVTMTEIIHQGNIAEIAMHGERVRSIKQLADAQAQLRQFQTQFQMDQRPVVLAHCCQFPGDNPLTVGRPLYVNIVYKNVGKGAALNVTHRARVVFGAETLKIRSDPADVIAAYERDLGPGEGPVFVTAVSVKQPYHTNFDILKNSDLLEWNGEQPIVVFGRFTYEDRFGNHYCTPYVEYMVNGNWANMSGGTLRVRDTRNPAKIIAEHKIPPMCPPGTIL